MNIVLDPKLPVRGVDFNNLIVLMRAISNLTPIRYTDALSLVTKDKVIVSSKNSGEALKKSSFYHHWSALKLLGFIEQLANKQYKISGRGRKLIDTTPDNTMNEERRGLFREGMLSSQEIWENFWVLFTCQTKPTLKPPLGNIVAFRPTSSKIFEKSVNTRHYIIEGTCSDYHIAENDSRIYQNIISGLRIWAKQCGLVDEIFPPTTSSEFHGISSFMYLIDPERETLLIRDTVSELISKHEKVAEPILEDTLKFDIPDLLALICVTEGIRLSRCRQLMLEWVQYNKYTVALERPSLGLIEVQKGKRNSRSTESSQPWLIRNGMKYTTLLVNRSAIS